MHALWLTVKRHAVQEGRHYPRSRLFSLCVIRYFFIYLLPHQAPTILKPLVDQIMNTTGERSLLVCGFSHHTTMSLLVHNSSVSIVPPMPMCATGELKHSVNKTLEAFEEVLRVYKSGLHLQQMPSSVIKGKRVLNTNPLI